jgi:SulP family sulfate permease
MVHAATLLIVILVAAPLASAIPLSALAAVLVMVAWNMSEIEHFLSLLRAPRSDVGVLLTTFTLTVFADLTIAVGVGLVLASLLFMKQMADVSNIRAITAEFDYGADDLAELKDPNAIWTRDVPQGVEVYEINGPLFFGVADRVKDILHRLKKPAPVFIVRMRRVPAIDASGIHALQELHIKCGRERSVLLLSGVHAQPLNVLVRCGLADVIGMENIFGNIDDALRRARELLALPAVPRPSEAEPEVARESSDRNG